MLVLDGMENSLYKYCSALKDYQPTGYQSNTPLGREPDSLTCIMTLLGASCDTIPDGRSAVEAYAADFPVADEDLIFRGSRLDISSSGIIIGSHSDKKAYEVENNYLAVKHLSGYKYLINIKNGRQYYNSIRAFPPHQSIGSHISEILPQGDSYITEILNSLINDHSIYAWSPSIKQQIPSFEAIHGYTGAVVAHTEIAVGIARAMGMYCPPLYHATADIDTDLHEKTENALELIRSYDFVMLHINGTDECSHRKDKQQKLSFIKKIDKQVISYILKNNTAAELIITADHETSHITGQHIKGQTCCYKISPHIAGAKNDN